jgi:hypothetical protein
MINEREINNQQFDARGSVTLSPLKMLTGSMREMKDLRTELEERDNQQ